MVLLFSQDNRHKEEFKMIITNFSLNGKVQSRFIALLYPESFELILRFPFVRGFFKGKLRGEVFLKNICAFKKQILDQNVDSAIVKYLEDVGNNSLIGKEKNAHRPAELNLIFLLYERIIRQICGLQPNDEIAKLLADSYDAALALCKKLTGDTKEFKAVSRMELGGKYLEDYSQFSEYFISLVRKAEAVNSQMTAYSAVVYEITSKCPIYNIVKNHVEPKSLDYEPLKRIKKIIINYIEKTSLRDRLKKPV